MLRVEFHCHTEFSKDSLTPVPQLIAAARASGVDRLVVTDHNNIGGALRARELAPELVIVGEEILTTRGELLAAFVQEEIPRKLEPMEAIRRLRDQGAFISVSHPFDRRRQGWALDDLKAIVPYIDAIEVFNARCQWSGLNKLAADFARANNLPGTAGSDGHTPQEIGRAVLVLPQFDGADGLRQVIRQGQVEGRLSSPFIHLTSTYARLVKKWRARR